MTSNIDRLTTMLSTHSKMSTTHFTTIPSTILSTRCTTQKCITSTTQLSSSEISSDSIMTDVTEITTDVSETMPITMITTIHPTISTTTFVTNETTFASEITADATISSNVTSEATSIITMETDRTFITTTTIKDSDTTVETTKPPMISTPMPKKCTKANTTIVCNKNIEFDYIVRDDETGRTCILTDMMIQINLRYAMKDSQIGNATLMVPTNATKTTSICEKKIAKMTLSWEESVKNRINNDNKENKITFHYTHNETKFFLDFISIDMYLDRNNFPRAQKKRMRGNTNRNLQLFSASINNEIFICEANTIINIENQINVVISDIRLIAFNKCIRNCLKPETDFAETNGIIALIFGAIGIILFLILIFRKWCFGRKRFQYC